MGVISISNNIIKLLLSTIFLLSGICKVTPKFHPDTFYLLDGKFRDSFTPYFQREILDKVVGDIRLDPVLFKTSIGYTEVVCALLLWIGLATQLSGG
jgi:uncharacterized membrane protein YphA (DoxX/SURF4 family)